MTIPANIDDVIQIVSDCFDEGTFTLADDALGPGEIQNLIDAYMQENQLVLTGASSSTQPNAIIVTGQGSNQPFGSTSVNAVFGFDDERGVATMNLAAVAQPGWTFAVSFPSLGTTFLPELEFDSGDEIGYGMYLASYDSDTTQYGLYFRGNLQLTGLLAQLNWLLGNGETIQVQGPINIHQGIPEMDLAAPHVIGDVSLGYFTVPGVDFDITSQLVPSNSEDTQSATATAVMTLSTVIRFQASNTRVNVPVSANFYNRPTYLQFNADLTDAVYATLDELSSLVAGQSLSALLGDVPLSDYVRLSTLMLQVNYASKQLMSVTMGIRTAQPFTLVSNPDAGFEKVISVDDIELTFRLTNPMTNPALGAMLFGEIDIFEDAKLDVSAVYPEYVFAAELEQGTNLNLVEVVQYFTGSINPDVPAINIAVFRLFAQVTPPSYSAIVVVDNEWPIPIGPTQLLIQQVRFGLDYNGPGTTQAEIGGSLVIGDGFALVDVDWQLPGSLSIQGTIPSIDLAGLIENVASVPLGFTLPAIALDNTNLLIQRLQNGGYFLAFGTTVTNPNFGTLELEFGETNAATGVTVGFALPENWKLTDLSNAFDVWLLRDITFTAASLLISSFDNPYFNFRSLSRQPIMPQYSSGGVHAGMYLYANLTLDTGANSAFGAVSNLLAGNEGEGQTGVTSLMVALSIPSNYSDTEFMASLDGGFTFIQTSSGTPVIVLDRMAMYVRPFQEYLDLDMEVSIYVMGVHLGLRGDVEVNGWELDLRLQTTTPWIEPFGIRGLTLNNMAAEFRFGATVALGLEGQVTLGTGSSAIVLTAAMEFNFEADFLPDVFFVSESGSINFGAIIGTFVASKYVPSMLNNVVLYQFSFLVIANPAGWTDAFTGQHLPFGIAFSGMVSVYGLVARFALQVNFDTGISASGQIDGPISLGPVHNGVAAVTIANASHWNEGPYIIINSAHSPYVNMSVALRIWELATIQLSATIADDAFYLSFSYTLTSVSAFGQMAVTAYIRNSSEFQFNAALSIAVSEIGPIKVGNKNLGTINPQLALAAYFTLDFGPRAQLDLSIGASFALSGYRMTLPDTTVNLSSTSLTSFSDIPGIFEQVLEDNLWDIGAVLFQDAQAFFQYVADGFFTLTDDIGNIMKNYLHLGLNEAASYLKSVAHSMAYGIEDVARLLKSGFKASVKDLASALKYAAYAVEDIAQVISDLYHKSAEAVAQVLKDIGYGLEQIATALDRAFNYTAKEVAKFFKETWNIADTLVNDALNLAGYAVSEVEKAMKDIFGWFMSAVESVGQVLNPLNW